jgi:hypothetical protein
MEAAINNVPHLLSQLLITQFTALIVDLLECLLKTSVGEHTNLTNLIIINSLDECMYGTQVQILSLPTQGHH